jgi:hypothetical protein
LFLDKLELTGCPFEESCLAVAVEKYVGKVIVMKPRVRHRRHCLHIGVGETDLEVVYDVGQREGARWVVTPAERFGVNLLGAYFISPWSQHGGMRLHVGGKATDVRVWPLRAEDWRASTWRFSPMGRIGRGCFSIRNAGRHDGEFLHVGSNSKDIRCYASDKNHDGNGWFLELA